jgi:hypothetical protein
METTELDRRFAQLKARCARLSAVDQEQALDGFTEIVTLFELPREPGETVSLSVSLHRSSEITHLSG